MKDIISMHLEGKNLSIDTVVEVLDKCMLIRGGFGSTAIKVQIGNPPTYVYLQKYEDTDRQDELEIVFQSDGDRYAVEKACSTIRENLRPSSYVIAEQ